MAERTRTWLFTLSPKYLPYEDFCKIYSRWLANHDMTEDWSSGSTKSIRKGDAIYVFKQGRGVKGIHGSGIAASDFKTHKNRAQGTKGFYNDLRFDVLLNPWDDPIMTLDEIKDIRVNWSTPGSGIEIKPPYDEDIRKRWAAFLLKQVINPGLGIPQGDADPGSPEGRAKMKAHRSYERDGQLTAKKKSAVLKAAGCLACEICDFDFLKRYGKKFCEVHHKHMLSLGERLTSHDDLAIVCSNCHRMIHSRFPMLTMEQVRAMLK